MLFSFLLRRIRQVVCSMVVLHLRSRVSLIAAVASRRLGDSFYPGGRRRNILLICQFG